MDYKMDLKMDLKQALGTIELMAHRLEELTIENAEKRTINADGSAYILYDDELIKCHLAAVRTSEGENKRIKRTFEFVEV